MADRHRYNDNSEMLSETIGDMMDLGRALPKDIQQGMVEHAEKVAATVRHRWPRLTGRSGDAWDVEPERRGDRRRPIIVSIVNDVRYTVHVHERLASRLVPAVADSVDPDPIVAAVQRAANREVE